MNTGGKLRSHARDSKSTIVLDRAHRDQLNTGIGEFAELIAGCGSTQNGVVKYPRGTLIMIREFLSMQLRIESDRNRFLSFQATFPEIIAVCSVCIPQGCTQVSNWEADEDLESCESFH